VTKISTAPQGNTVEELISTCDNLFMMTFMSVVWWTSSE